ncbi:MAG: sulfatase [Myxococcota bacterium]|nr:sulfatase [Myxococcota bacterium]
MDGRIDRGSSLPVCSRRFRVSGALLLVTLVAWLAGCEQVERPNILLITVDTLRADSLDLDSALPGASATAASRTPRLASLAAQGTVFRRATAPMSLTRPSHFSILTGRYPREHGVVNNQLALPAEAQSVSRELQRAGYATAGFVAVSLLGRGSGAEHGFEHFVAPERALEWRASRVVDAASQWLDSLEGDAPFFAWVHLFDPHQPYDPPADARAGLDADLLRRHPVLGWQQFLEIAKASGGQISFEVARHAQALYAAEVSAVDREVGRLLEKVDARFGADETVVVFTADHGECFENGVYFEHSDCLFEGGVRVPLIVRYPKEFESGKQVDDLVSNADVAPTLLQAAGLEVPAEMTVPSLRDRAAAGTREVLLQNPFYPSSVLPARRHRQVVIRRVAGESVAPFESGAPRLGLVRGDWKYLRGERGDELYAVSVDAKPEVNVAYREREARSVMGAALDAALERHPAAAIESSELNPELLQSLRALGYVE